MKQAENQIHQIELASEKAAQRYNQERKQAKLKKILEPKKVT
jgi:hypothetical protein